jgi:glutaryl-CoA dehydrogenase
MTISAPETTRDVQGDRSGQNRLPSATGDFYDIASLLDEVDGEIVGRVRAFAEKEVAPVINKYWMRAEFPFELIPKMASLGVAGLSYAGCGWPARSPMLDGFIAMELARVDSSIATFFGVHGGLAMGSIYLCGSDEQRQQWLPGMHRMETIGAFGLTEPEVGSGAAGSRRRERPVDPHSGRRTDQPVRAGGAADLVAPSRPAVHHLIGG